MVLNTSRPSSSLLSACYCCYWKPPEQRQPHPCGSGPPCGVRTGCRWQPAAPCPVRNKGPGELRSGHLTRLTLSLHSEVDNTILLPDSGCSPCCLEKLCSSILVPWSCLLLSLGSGAASYFLPWGTGAGHLEKQWSFPLWRGGFKDSLHKPLHMMDFGDWQLDMG